MSRSPTASLTSRFHCGVAAATGVAVPATTSASTTASGTRRSLGTRSTRGGYVRPRGRRASRGRIVALQRCREALRSPTEPRPSIHDARREGGDLRGPAARGRVVDSASFPSPRATELRVTTIDRTRLAGLMEREQALFRERHPKSRELYEAGKDSLLYGVPM